MWIKRDLSDYFSQNATLPVQVVWGPRQCGKSSMLLRISPEWTHITLDDLGDRRLAQEEPELFLKQNPTPLIINEAQYAPHLFSQIKIAVDRLRAKEIVKKPLFRLTGSHQILLDTKIKESLGGRASFFRLHGFSLSELGTTRPEIEEFIFRGAWPEMTIQPELSAVEYLNDYIRTVVEKDVAGTAGVRDLGKFQLALGLLAARVGELLSYESLARKAGISGATLKSWVIDLERSGLAGLLRPYHTNLNKRLVKTPKFYFLDTGLASRLQGHTDIRLMFKSPAFGHLFENLVLTEILKARDHHRKNWQITFWRSKEGEEYDFIIQSSAHTVVLEAEVAMQSPKKLVLSALLRRDLGPNPITSVVCTYGGRKAFLSDECQQIPVSELGIFLQQLLT
jgi:predicted AAA+ superfamily ATPase